MFLFLAGDVRWPGNQGRAEVTSSLFAPGGEAGDACRGRIRAAVHPRHGCHHHLLHLSPERPLQDTGETHTHRSLIRLLTSAADIKTSITHEYMCIQTVCTVVVYSLFHQHLPVFGKKMEHHFLCVHHVVMTGPRPFRTSSLKTTISRLTSAPKSITSACPTFTLICHIMVVCSL